MDAVTSYGVEFPVSVWMKKISVSSTSMRVIVVMEPVERTSACFSLDHQVGPLFSLLIFSLVLGSYLYTVEPPNNGHIGNEHFVHCSEVEMYERGH